MLVLLLKHTFLVYKTNCLTNKCLNSRYNSVKCATEENRKGLKQESCFRGFFFLDIHLDEGCHMLGRAEQGG